MYVCMYVSVTLRNPIISCATRKHSITCTSVTLRNVTAVAVPEETKLYNEARPLQANQCLLGKAVGLPAQL